MKLSGAQAVVTCLWEQGIDTVFGYPGGTVLPIYDALVDSPLRHILTVHEQGAAHAADGYARASGKIGVCLATSGPGATNLVTGIATAFMDSVPLLAITGQVPTGLIGRDAFQEVDIMGITMPITKHNFQVKEASEIPRIICQAIKIAVSGRPGPVLVDIPKNIQLAEFEYCPEPNVKEDIFSQVETDCSRLKEMVAAINQAERPVIIVGGGVVTAKAQQEVRSFDDKTSIPVVSTLMGLGVISSGDPRFLGLTGMHGAKIANTAVHEADLIIAIGSRFSDRVTGDRSSYVKQKIVIHIDVDPAEIDKNVDTYIGLIGELKNIIPKIEALVLESLHSKWWNEIKGWPKDNCEYAANPNLSAPWLMEFINCGTKHQPYVFVTDVGQHQMWAAQYLHLDQPRGWITSGGLGTMGFGLPAAMGAQLAVKDKRVVNICGDAGFKMTGNELYTIATYDIPVITIVINNSGLGMVRQLQHLFCDKRYSQVNLSHRYDFVKFAECCGVKATEANTKEEFAEAFHRAQAELGPYLIVANISPTEWVVPMVVPSAEINVFVDFDVN